MVVRVGGSFAYLPGDGILEFEDTVRTVGELRQAIEEATNIPGVKQVRRGCCCGSAFLRKTDVQRQRWTVAAKAESDVGLQPASAAVVVRFDATNRCWR